MGICSPHPDKQIAGPMQLQHLLQSMVSCSQMQVALLAIATDVRNCCLSTQAAIVKADMLTPGEQPACGARAGAQRT